MPYAVRSDDERVHIEGDASAFLSFEERAWTEGWIEIYPGPVDDLGRFAELSGIQGVDLGSLSQARWFTALRFGHSEPAFSGEVTVQEMSSELIERLSW